MSDEKPEKTDGRGGPGDQGRGRRSGRRRGFRGRRGGARDESPESAGAREGQAPKPRDPTNGGAAEDQARPAVQQPGRESQAPKPRELRPPRPEEMRDMPACPICGKPVYDLSSALAANREAGDPAHFDCVLERVAASESLAPEEKLVYLGSGSFGVVEFKDKSESHFTVKRRIQWEKEGEKKDWRKGLSSRISNL
jgi:hypothetical protein